MYHISFEIEFHHVAQNGLEHMLLWPHPPKWRNFRYVQPLPIDGYLGSLYILVTVNSSAIKWE
jgi:hypothetical protein